MLNVRARRAAAALLVSLCLACAENPAPSGDGLPSDPERAGEAGNDAGTGTDKPDARADTRRDASSSADAARADASAPVRPTADATVTLPPRDGGQPAVPEASA